MLASSNGHTAVAKLLLKSSADANHQGKDGGTAFVAQIRCQS